MAERVRISALGRLLGCWKLLSHLLRRYKGTLGLAIQIAAERRKGILLLLPAVSLQLVTKRTTSFKILGLSKPLPADLYTHPSWTDGILLSQAVT